MYIFVLGFPYFKTLQSKKEDSIGKRVTFYGSFIRTVCFDLGFFVCQKCFRSQCRDTFFIPKSNFRVCWKMYINYTYLLQTDYKDIVRTWFGGRKKWLMNCSRVNIESYICFCNTYNKIKISTWKTTNVMPNTPSFRRGVERYWLQIRIPKFQKKNMTLVCDCFVFQTLGHANVLFLL